MRPQRHQYRFSKADLAAAAKVHRMLKEAFADVQAQACSLSEEAARETAKPVPNTEQCEALVAEGARLKAVMEALQMVQLSAYPTD